MNRGSLAPRMALPSRLPAFNEAPIHESGKSDTGGPSTIRPLDLQ